MTCTTVCITTSNIFFLFRTPNSTSNDTNDGKIKTYHSVNYLKIVSLQYVLAKLLFGYSVPKMPQTRNLQKNINIPLTKTKAYNILNAIFKNPIIIHISYSLEIPKVLCKPTIFSHNFT